MKLRLTISRKPSRSSETTLVSESAKSCDSCLFKKLTFPVRSNSNVHQCITIPRGIFLIRISVNKKERKASCNSQVTRERNFYPYYDPGSTSLSTDLKHFSRSDPWVLKFPWFVSEPVMIHESLIIKCHFIRALIRRVSFRTRFGHLKKVTFDRSTNINLFYVELYL